MKNKILGLPKAAVIVIGIGDHGTVSGVDESGWRSSGTSDIHYRQLHVTADRRDRCSNLCNRYAVSYRIPAVT